MHNFMAGNPAGPQMTAEQMMHFYAGMITRALEQNRLRPIVVR